MVEAYLRNAQQKKSFFIRYGAGSRRSLAAAIRLSAEMLVSQLEARRSLVNAQALDRKIESHPERLEKANPLRASEPHPTEGLKLGKMREWSRIKLKGKWSSNEVWLDDKPLTPARSLGLANHSPTGFSWGYGGSGPAQLALAVLLEITDEASALATYQDFKWAVIAQLPRSDFEIELENTKVTSIDAGLKNSNDLEL